MRTLIWPSQVSTSTSITCTELGTPAPMARLEKRRIMKPKIMPRIPTCLSGDSIPGAIFLLSSGRTPEAVRSGEAASISRQGAFEPAIADVNLGLELASEPNYFRGHLLETEGLVEERQAKALETKDPAAAAAARARAIGLLEQAMAVQAGVIASAAPEGSSAPNPAASAAPAPPKAPGAP